MQIKLNKKSQYLIFRYIDGRDEYEINFLLDIHLGALKLEDIFDKIKKFPGHAIIIPNSGYIFEDNNLIDKFTNLNGILLKEQDKIVILTQGNFSFGNLGISTYGKNIDFINIYTPKLQIGIISPFLQLDSFKVEKMPYDIQDSNVIMANSSFATLLLAEEYPMYIFWGNTNDFVSNTGITEFEKKENIKLKKVDKNSLNRTIYVLE